MAAIRTHDGQDSDGVHGADKGPEQQALYGARGVDGKPARVAQRVGGITNQERAQKSTEHSKEGNRKDVLKEVLPAAVVAGLEDDGRQEAKVKELGGKGKHVQLGPRWVHDPRYDSNHDPEQDD